MDAETGEEYLTKMNFRSLVEWITAETLLARPDDPMAYARTLLEKKMDMVQFLNFENWWIIEDFSVKLVKSTFLIRLRDI